MSDAPDEEMKKVAHLGLRSCQVGLWDQTYCTARAGEALAAAAKANGVGITTIWAGWPGPAVWNFTDGPRTIGLVPPEHRRQRVEARLAVGVRAR